MSFSAGNKSVIGALTTAERAIIDERDGYRDKFFAAETEEEQGAWMQKVNDATARYDEIRARRRAAGEID
jgi:hypothetical protein